MKWEYKVIELNSDTGIIKKISHCDLWNEKFNELGKEGWELIAITPLNLVNQIAVFKRKV